MWAIAVVVLAVVAGWRDWRRWRQPFLEYVFLLVARLYARLWQRWSCPGAAPWPDSGPVLIVSNHTCSSDPMFLLAATRRPIGFVVSREHYTISRLTRWILETLGCVPTSRTGHDWCSVREVLQNLRKGRLVCIFPEGNLSGVARGRMRPWKHGAAYAALVGGVPVYPVYIAGGPRTHKLVPAWLHRSSRWVRVFFGPAIDLTAYRAQKRDRRLLEEVTNLLRDRVQALGDQNSRRR